MMDNQPLNLLTNTSQASPSATSLAEQQPGSAGSGNNQRQMALTSIFNSLSSLAANSTHRDQQPAASVSTLQSVMAAAMLQQQNQIHHQDPTSTKNILVPEQFNLYNNPDLVAPNQQQRINYCTICNKELCNKYFMKTHMIKMHGINLEMEPSDEAQEDRAGEGEEADSNDTRNLQKFTDQQQQQTDKSVNKNSSDQSANIKMQDKSTAKTTYPKKNQTQYPSSTPKKKTLNTNNNQNSKQTTSVLNGFAGNSMGGVVCDICNKELCSKYFLKVHKQNTHGIADYPDATSQFTMYPFSSPIAAPNPFLATGPPATISQNFSPFGVSNMNIFSSPNLPGEEFSNSISDCSHEKTKKPRLSVNKHSSPRSSHNERHDECLNFNSPSESSSKQQMDSVYRLLIAQQQQHQLIPPIPSASATSLMQPMDPMAAAALSAVNPLNALMCFGAVGPLGPFATTGMSPATIVDNILRNQHLFNRNNNIQPPNVSPTNQSILNSKGTDGNNNSDSNQNNSKSSSKETSNSRYFSHYTEACPMCDRRFKSIKWLKTHMMNDHKQEIGAYMQMMMQYIYTSKSQQMAAAATMAAFEQQQHNLNINQQNLIRHLTDHSMPNQNQELLSAQATNLTNHKPYPNLIDSFQNHQQHHHHHHHHQQQQQYQNQNTNNLAITPKEFQLRQAYQYSNGCNSPENMSAQLDYTNEQAKVFSLAERCRSDSLSSDELNVKHSLSPSTSTLRKAHEMNNKQAVLNFELNESKQLKQDDEDPLLSELTRNDSNDSAEDLSRDSNLAHEEADSRKVLRGSPESKANIEQQGATNHLSIKN